MVIMPSPAPRPPWRGQAPGWLTRIEAPPIEPRAASMAEQELLGVDQDPTQVLNRLARFLGVRQVLGRGGEFAGVRLAGQGDPVELADDLLGRLAALGEAGHAATVVA